MTRIAFVQDGRVSTLLPEGRTLAECPEGIRPNCYEVGDEVGAGWLRLDDGTFAARFPRTLDEAKAEALARIAAARYEAEVAGTVWNGWPVQTDRDSRPSLIAMYTAARDGMRAEGGVYKFADGVFRPLTNLQAMEMALTVLGFVQAMYDAEDAKGATITAATTNAEADAVTWG